MCAFVIERSSIFAISILTWIAKKTLWLGRNVQPNTGAWACSVQGKLAGLNRVHQNTSVRSNRDDIITNTSPAFTESDMNWTRFALIVIGSGIVSSLTDWCFAGDWLHRRYTYPEIWRQGNARAGRLP